LVKGYAELKGYNPQLAELYIKAHGMGKDNELPQEFQNEMQQFLKGLKADLGKEIKFLNTVAKFTAKTDFNIDFEKIERFEKEETKPEPIIKRRKNKGIDLSP
jgi:hypothetical protein